MIGKQIPPFPGSETIVASVPIDMPPEPYTLIALRRAPPAALVLISREPDSAPLVVVSNIPPIAAASVRTPEPLLTLKVMSAPMPAEPVPALCVKVATLELFDVMASTREALRGPPKVNVFVLSLNPRAEEPVMPEEPE